ncbi:unnamed protein product, partial [Gongylonema pulchrum]|uniref:OB domain-containing protein n=1 Tax=Gongylonema pulchrum TaxID=637853 RepID=A0A183D2M6_9BILA
MDYEILGRNLPVFGNPVHHSGNPADYRGLNVNAGLQKNKPEHRTPEKPTSVLAQATPSGRPGGPSSHCVVNLVSQNLTPIKLITPYVNKWRICGMVTAKEEMRTFKTARKETRVFNFEITDEEGGCIRIAAFDDVADKFFSIIQKGA